MNKILLIILFSIYSLIRNLNYCYSQNNYYSSFDNVKLRPIALGGAFTSINDDLAAVFYNPAALNLYKNEKKFKFTFFLNPVLSGLAFSKYTDKFHNKISSQEFLNSSALICKAVFLSTRYFDTGVIIGEQSLKYSINEKSLFGTDVQDLWNNRSHTLISKFKLAKRASIGISGVYCYNKDMEELKKWVGFSYGILLKPNDKLNVGLAFVDYPDTIPDYNFPIERMADETMNIGVSCKLPTNTIISFDVRNLTEESEDNVREFHVGIEQTIFSIAALRFGFFRERLTENKYYSFGVGLVDSNLFFNKDNHFKNPNFIISYSFVYKDCIEKFYRYHFMSLLFRI